MILRLLINLKDLFYVPRNKMDSTNPLKLVSLSCRIIQIISNTEILTSNLQLMSFSPLWNGKDIRNTTFFNPLAGEKSITLTRSKSTSTSLLLIYLSKPPISRLRLSYGTLTQSFHLLSTVGSIKTNFFTIACHQLLWD